MAFTERYVRADAAGGGDGTTNTNSGANGAWTLAEGITNEAAGMRLNVLAGTYANTTTGRTFAAVGTTTAPIWWRGFKLAIGDQDANNVAVAGTDIPGLTFTTGQMVVSGAHHIFSNIDVSSACVTASGAVSMTGAGSKAYRIRITNTAANSNARTITTGPSVAGSLAACYFKATSTADRCVSLGGSTVVNGCIITGGIVGIAFTASGSMALYSIFDSQAGDGITINNVTGALVSGCSFYAPVGNGINITVVPVNGLTLINNYFENVNQVGKAAIANTSGTNTNLITAVANTYYNCTSNTSGFGDSPLIFDNGTLGSAGFVDPSNQNFAINPVLRALGFPGANQGFENTAVYQGYLDPGAVQRQEPSASPVVIRPFPGLGALLTM